MSSSFSRLESLKLDGLEEDNVISVLTSLALVPRLFALTIFVDDFTRENHVINQLIFRLPVLKFAKILLRGLCSLLSFPLATSEHQQSNTLKHIIVDTHRSLASIYSLLSYTPQLRHLSADWITSRESSPTEGLNIPVKLTHLTLSHSQISFDEFESLISTIGSQLEALRISIGFDTDSLNAHRWQQLILRHMPRLRTFIFDYYGLMIEDAYGHTSCRTLLEQFSSSFWIERQWFFAHKHRQIYTSGKPSLVFYSTQSHWRNSCKINEFL